MLDEVAPEILFIAGAGTIAVCCLMALVWYLSTGEEPSSKKKKEDEKEADVGGKSKRKKQHLSPRKRKETTTKSENASNNPSDTASQPKSILKEHKDEQPSPRPHHVDFQKEVPATKEPKHPTQTHLPTPHPQANTRLPSLTDDVKPKSSTKEEKKPASAPQSKSTDKTSPKPKLAKPSDVSSGPSTDQQLPSKKKTKSKQPSASEGNVVNGIVWSRYNNVLFGEHTRQNNGIFR